MTDGKTRLIGALVAAMGAACAYFFVWQPLDEARRQVATVNLSLKGAFVVPAFLLLGTLFVAFGQRGRAWLQIEEPGRRKLKPAGWIVALACIGAGIGLHQWLEAALRGYGYNV